MKHKYYHISKKNILIIFILIGSAFFILSLIIIFHSKSKNHNNQSILNPSVTINPKTMKFKKEHHLCTLISLNQDNILGRWKYFGNVEGEVPVSGVLELQSDNTLTLTGFYNNSFISKGKWSFNPSNNVIKIVLFDNVDILKKDFNKDILLSYRESEKKYNYESNIIDLGTTNDSVFAKFKIIKDGLSPRDRCNVSINYFGWTFTHVIRAEDVLSREELKEYKKIMKIE